MKKWIALVLICASCWAQDHQMFTTNTMGIEVTKAFNTQQEIFCGKRSEYNAALAKVSHAALSGTLDGLNAGSKAFNMGNVGAGMQNVGAGLGIGLAFGLIQFSIDKYKEDNQYMLVRMYGNDTQSTVLISLLIVDKGLEPDAYKVLLEAEQARYIK